MKDEKFNKLRDIFFESDPMQLGVVENNLIDEYDAEIELILANQENMEKDRNGVIELIEFVIDEMFDTWVELDAGFIDNVAEVLL